MSAAADDYSPSSPLRRAAEQGDAGAQYSYGLHYLMGKGEVHRDYAEAVKWFHKAAKQGHIQAQIKLAKCYMNGTGVSKNPAEAVKWFRRAAEKGNTQAQILLARCYMEGIGVDQNYVEGSKWYLKAAEQGHTLAKRSLKAAAERGIEPAKQALQSLEGKAASQSR